MTEQQNPPKVPPFVQPDPPTVPRINNRRGGVSQRGMLSLVMMILSLISMLVLMISWLKLALDIFDQGLTVAMASIWAKVAVMLLTFAFGWLTGVLSIRVYGNLILPYIIKSLSWVVMAGVASLYIAIIQRLYVQKYDLLHFLAYILMIGAGLALLVGFHLILEDHDLRPYAIPLLVIALVHLYIIVFRYVFTSDVDATRLLYDILFFGVMTTVSALMMAHRGVLNPFRNAVTKFFDQNSHTLRPES